MCSFFQDFQSFADLIAHGVFRDFELSSYFLIFKTVPLAQQEDFAAFFRQGINCSPEPSLYLGAFLQVVLIDDSISIIRFQLFSLKALLAKMVKAPVADSHIEVRLAIDHHITRIDFLPQRRKTLLNHVFCNIRIVQIVQGVEAQGSVIM